MLSFTQAKNAGRKPVHLELPVLPGLAQLIAASLTGPDTQVVNEFGPPFTPDGFGNSSRKWCRDAGLAECTAHSLRKIEAAITAENGATPHQLMAIIGWTPLRQAEKYTKKANQRRLTQDEMGLLRDA